MSSTAEKGEEFVATVASKTHIPFAGVVLIILVVVGVLVAIFYLCCQKWWKKFRADRNKVGMAGKVDIKSVQLLGQTYKEKVSGSDSDSRRDCRSDGRSSGRSDSSARDTQRSARSSEWASHSLRRIFPNRRHR